MFDAYMTANGDIEDRATAWRAVGVASVVTLVIAAAAAYRVATARRTGEPIVSHSLQRHSLRVFSDVGIVDLTALSLSERAAIEALRIRGAAITVFQ